MTSISIRNSNQINVIQGDYSVSNNPECFMSTILGSCVATCMYDPVSGIGGMNHYLLPDGEVNPNERVIHGLYAMELLINEILKLGGIKENLEAKLFGGARIINNVSDIGAKNAKFGREFLMRENIPCVAESLGGIHARRVKFWPTTGKVRQLHISDPKGIDTNLRPVSPPPPAPAPQDEIELF